MILTPKTWTDEEIVDLMVKEALEYRKDKRNSQQQIDYRGMMECVLSVMDDRGLIEKTP
jgi:hypothetical protein